MEYSKLSKRELIEILDGIRKVLNEFTDLNDLAIKPRIETKIKFTHEFPKEIRKNNSREIREDLPMRFRNEIEPASYQNDLENLIGKIPFLLLNQEIFEKNQDIADFAQKLNILIPSPEKKKREDIIGRVISAIAKFDSNNIAKLNIALQAINKPTTKKDKSNFFKDWANVIKEINL